MNQPIIDFSLLGGPVYIGRRLGEQLRKELNIDALDASIEPVTVTIPEDTYVVSSSFFLGMFGPSIQKFATTEAFYKHYLFTLPEHLTDATLGYAEYALEKRL